MSANCSRRDFLTNTAKALAGAAMAGGGAWWHGADFEPNHLEVVRLSVPIPRLPRAFDGFGLYITRLIVEAHGGQVYTESEVGKGSNFYVRLPLA